MSDEVDRANDAAAFLLQVALANYRQPHNQPSREICAHCGNAIPPARRLAVPGVALCVDCQRVLELKEKCR